MYVIHKIGKTTIVQSLVRLFGLNDAHTNGAGGYVYRPGRFSATVLAKEIDPP